MNFLSVSSIVLSAILNASGSALMKFSTVYKAKPDSSKPLFWVITIGALMLFGICFPFYAYGLARIKLSVAQPIFAVGTFIFAALMAFFLFHDSFSVLKICGLSIIIVGVIMVANG